MMLNIAMNEYFQSVRKTKHSKLKESPETDPRTLVEPTNRFPLTADRCSMAERANGKQVWNSKGFKGKAMDTNTGESPGHQSQSQLLGNSPSEEEI